MSSICLSNRPNLTSWLTRDQINNFQSALNNLTYRNKYLTASWLAKKTKEETLNTKRLLIELANSGDLEIKFAVHCSECGESVEIFDTYYEAREYIFECPYCLQESKTKNENIAIVFVRSDK